MMETNLPVELALESVVIQSLARRIWELERSLEHARSERSRVEGELVKANAFRADVDDKARKMLEADGGYMAPHMSQTDTMILHRLDDAIQIISIQRQKSDARQAVKE